MQTRLAGMLPINVRGMWIGTFHGLCNRLLRAHYRDAGLPQLFQILDSADQQAAVKRLLKSLNVDDEKFPPRELCHFINAQKEQGLRAAAVEAWDDWARKRVGLYEAYEAQCQREGVVDFAELLLRSYELLERNEPLRRHYQERFRHILVDEFQDTNRLQYAWLCCSPGASRSRGSMVNHPNPLPEEGGDYSEAPRRLHLCSRRRRSEHLRLPRRRRRQHGRLRARVQGAEPDPPRAELPLPRQHPRCGQRHHQEQPVAPGQEPVDRGRQRRADPHLRILFGWRRSALDRRGSQGPVARRPCARRDRPALPQQRPVAGAGTRAVQCRPALSRVWRPALLRARRNQACTGLSAPDRQHRRRHGLRPRGEFPGARHRRAQPRKPAGCGEGRRQQPACGDPAGGRRRRRQACRLRAADRHADAKPRICRCRNWSTTSSNSPACAPITRTRRKARSGWPTSTN